MPSISLCVLVLALLLPSCWSAGCHSTTPQYGTPNYYPVLQGDSQLVLENSVDNGHLYTVAVPNSVSNSTTNMSSSFYVVHLYGTPEDWGTAQGQLLGDVIKQFFDDSWAYLESQIEEVLKDVPEFLQKMVADLGLDAALDLTYDITKEYTNSDIFVELKALAKAAGVDYKKARRFHMLAGLTQGKCSMFGAWGDALDPNTGIDLLQLRALDWDMDGPFRDFSAITIYHPSDSSYGHSFANIGFPGFVGSISGISSAQLAISEIGVTYPDASFGHESRIGYPFIFLLRDILQYDQTIDDATSRMMNARRTCDLLLGVGDGKSSQFHGYSYSYSQLSVFNDTNLLPYNETWHPRIQDVVYWGMDWLCPAYNTVLSEQIKKYWGAITPEVAIQNITAIEMSGDNHLIYYDLTNMNIYVSFAAPHNVAGPSAAYARQFTQLSMTKAFNLQ